jgi:hypothetical protein
MAVRKKYPFSIWNPQTKIWSPHKIAHARSLEKYCTDENTLFKDTPWLGDQSIKKPPNFDDGIEFYRKAD